MHHEGLQAGDVDSDIVSAGARVLHEGIRVTGSTRGVTDCIVNIRNCVQGIDSCQLARLNVDVEVLLLRYCRLT